LHSCHDIGNAGGHAAGAPLAVLAARFANFVELKDSSQFSFVGRDNTTATSKGDFRKRQLILVR